MDTECKLTKELWSRVFLEVSISQCLDLVGDGARAWFLAYDCWKKNTIICYFSEKFFPLWLLNREMIISIPFEFSQVNLDDSFFLNQQNIILK